MKQLVRILALSLLPSIGAASPLIVRRDPGAARARDASTQAASAPAVGIGDEVDVVGRVVGGGETLFRTAVDVSNNTNTATQVDFYYDVLVGGVAVELVGSLTDSGIVAQGTGTLGARSVFHSDDFVDDLRAAGAAIPGNLTAAEEGAGVIGGMLVIFNSPRAGLFDQVGQGSAQARFYSSGCSGTIGVSVAGHELTTTEPKSLVGIARDTRGEAGTPQLYTNFFVTNEGYVNASTHAFVANPVTLKLTWYNSAGAVAGTYTLPAALGVGQTAVLGNVFALLGASPAAGDSIVVFIDVTSGDSGISGVASYNDNGSKDPSAAPFHRGTWTSGR